MAGLCLAWHWFYSYRWTNKHQWARECSGRDSSMSMTALLGSNTDCRTPAPLYISWWCPWTWGQCWCRQYWNVIYNTGPFLLLFSGLPLRTSQLRHLHCSPPRLLIFPTLSASWSTASGFVSGWLATFCSWSSPQACRLRIFWQSTATTRFLPNQWLRHYWWTSLFCLSTLCNCGTDYPCGYPW